MTGLLALTTLTAASDPRPDDNNVVAGWVGAVVLVALVIAVVFIFRSFTKQLKKVDAAEKAGVYGTKEETSGSGSDLPPTHQRQD
jgi:hypothetical protein